MSISTGLYPTLDLWNVNKITITIYNTDRLTPYKQFLPDKKLSTGDISDIGMFSVSTGSAGGARPMSSLSAAVTSTG
jgi:hypothetical protein